jgi:hypothetical protein
MNRLESLSESAALDTALRQELAPGERILWSARPDPKRMRAVFLIWTFAIPWTLFSLFWEGTALSAMIAGFVKNDSNFTWLFIIFPIFGLPFVGIGLWMMNKPFAALADARHTLHMLTDKRIMTLTMRGDKSLKSVEVNKCGPITRKEKPDGWGSLSIETGSHRDSDGDKVTDTFALYGIPDVAKLERLLREAQQAH